MLTFIASRITSGNVLFPDKIVIDGINVTYYKGHLTGYQSTIIAKKNIASVYIGSGLLFGDVTIETIGGKRITASGFNKSDAKSIVAYLSLSEQTGGNINQNVYVNSNKILSDEEIYFEKINKQEIIDTIKRILIITNSFPVINQLTQIVTSVGFKVAAISTDGINGIKKYKELYPNIDMIAIEMNMPEMDGISTLEKIIEFDNNAFAIMISALGWEKKVKIALEKGARNFIVKPFDRRKVIERITSI